MKYFIAIILFLTSLPYGKYVGQKADCEYKKTSRLDMLSQRWLNTYTQVHNINSGITSSYNIEPEGYFQMNSDNGYERFSNGDYLKGTWQINANCQLVLDYGARLQRKFEIIKLTFDSLTITRRENNEIYIQHYKSIPVKLYVIINKRNNNRDDN